MSYNSRSPPALLQDRTVSIYGKSQMFENANSELRFAKSYHQKLYHQTPYDIMKQKSEEQQPLSQKNATNDKNNFQNSEMKQFCSNQIHDNWLRKYNSPTFARSNPILQNGNENVQSFKSTSKKTIFSDVSHINMEHNERSQSKPAELNKLQIESTWKPCLKKVNLQSNSKTTKATDEIQTRHSKEVPFSKCYNRNPILDGDPKSIYQSKSIKTEAPISQEYRKHKERKDVLPSNRVPITSIDLPRSNIISHIQPQSTKAANEITKQAVKERKNASTESGVNSLIAYQFAGKYRPENVTGKCNQYKQEERQVQYQQVNSVDHRKKKIMTAQQNDNKRIMRY